MRFSIWPAPAQPWDDILEITAHCEQTGWDGVYFVPDSTLGSLSRKKDTCDLFIEQVAPAFR